MHAFAHIRASTSATSAGSATGVGAAIAKSDTNSTNVKLMRVLEYIARFGLGWDQEI
ncbi:hypothetical protein FIBSPDRAFT_854604 [Athelia psychrophila]|uniref:Uncharacterized protein n=1 Tax=Athelia psychrophila TaxID=1759441 RepID=A0A166PXV1_9AGAM|nr:hypothetical protein FIBSPDRAFT_854604 [Fibularhizoctonia sp. CBS 109695]